VNEREKIVLSVLVKYWCIQRYHKYKVDDVELRMIKLVLTIGLC